MALQRLVFMPFAYLVSLAAQRQPSGSPAAAQPQPSGSPAAAQRQPSGSPAAAQRQPSGSPAAAQRQPSGSPVVELLTRNPKIEGSNPVAGTGGGKINIEECEKGCTSLYMKD